MEERVSNYHIPHQKWAGQVGLLTSASSKKVLNYSINNWYAHRFFRLKVMISSCQHFYDNLSFIGDLSSSFLIECMTVGYSLFHYLLLIISYTTFVREFKGAARYLLCIFSWLARIARYCLIRKISRRMDWFHRKVSSPYDSCKILLCMSAYHDSLCNCRWIYVHV